MAHKHSVYDTDKHFVIDPITRAITNQTPTKTKLMQYDHNSERFTFEMPRFIEGHDMTLCNKVELHYINVASNKSGQSNGVYVIDDLQTSPEDENVVICSWLISKKATKYAGTLNFRLRFACIDENTKIVYDWHTEIFKSISVSDGIDNADDVHEEYSDILEAWKAEITKSFAGRIDGAGEIFNYYKNNVATEEYAHAEGTQTKATGVAAHAEGRKCQANGKGSHAEGGTCKPNKKGSPSGCLFLLYSEDFEKGFARKPPVRLVVPKSFSYA